MYPLRTEAAMTSRVSSLLACATPGIGPVRFGAAAGSGQWNGREDYGPWTRARGQPRRRLSRLRRDGLPAPELQDGTESALSVVYRRPEVLARWIANAPVKMLDRYILNPRCLKATKVFAFFSKQLRFE